MILHFLTRNILYPYEVRKVLAIQLFSTKPYSQIKPQSNYRKQISLANLLQRYGFPPSQLQIFLTKNRFLLNSDLLELEKSLGILLSFKIPQKSLISLICECPGVLEFEFLRKWELGGAKLNQMSLSPLVIRNVLEHSRKFEIDPDRFFFGLKILKGLGFSDGTVTRVLGEFPKVITMKEIEICRKIDFLLGIGVLKDDIDRFFYLFPEILGLGIESKIKPLLDEFGNLGFGIEEIRKEIAREPRILGMEVGELSRCLDLLKSLKCREPIKEKIFSEGVFRAGFEVKRRVDFLCKQGLIRREAFTVLWKEPRVIMYSIEDTEKKIDFLVNRMRFNKACLVEVPEYLGVNFEKQIVARYNVIEYLRSKGGLGYEVGLKGMIRLSRLRFYNLYVKPYPECEKLYGRFAGNVGGQQRHPVGLWKIFKPPSYPQSKEDVENMKSFVQSLV